LQLGCELTQEKIAGRVGVSQVHISRAVGSASATAGAACGLAFGA
jgi:DNA-directed RNA polymerase specialized sigma subunit